MPNGNFSTEEQADQYRQITFWIDQMETNIPLTDEFSPLEIQQMKDDLKIFQGQLEDLESKIEAER